jgi:hypothetical protein
MGGVIDTAAEIISSAPSIEGGMPGCYEILI